MIAAFYPLAYAAERIGGPAYDVRNLTPPGAEPHDLELTPRTIGRIEDADVVLYLGHGFQPAVAKAAREGPGTRVDLLAGLPLHGSDPHVWLDPVLYARVARRIASVLHRPAAPFLADLRRLDGQRLADVIRLVRKTHATTVFFETLVSPRLAKTVARDAGARTAVLDPIEGAEDGETYLTLMRKNLAELRKALACR